MPNRNPSPSTRYKSEVDVSNVLPFSVKVPEPYHSALRNYQGNTSEYIRNALIKQMKEDGLI